MPNKQNPVDILIVDDRIDGLIALEAVLDMPDINLVKAQSGREALELLSHYDFGVILLDVQMPEMDGFETAIRIRQNEKYRLTPIIFVTAINKDDRYIYRGYEAGAVDYIFKPFEPQILRAKVSVFMELFRKSRQLEDQAEKIRESERRERYLRLTELENESLKRYRALADAIPHMVWRARNDGMLDYVNKGWIDYTGLSLEQSSGNGWHSAIDSEDLKSFLKCWMDSMTDGRAFEAELKVRNAKGEYHWFWVKTVAEINQMGQVASWLGTCTDINDRKITEMKLIKAEKEAKAASVSKTSFLANMSHEIRTPMNAILGFTELMLDPYQTAEERIECIHTVQRNASQLLKIIDEILDISKVESGHMQIEKVEVNVPTLLDDLKNLLQLQAADKGLELRFGLDTEIPRTIISDPTRLRQILLNLIGNAIKFTQKGSVVINVAWHAKESAEARDKMEFRIIDTGVGVSAEHAHRLFQPFMQEDSSTTRKFGGTGLGLALSRQLARAMGGDISLLRSEQGKGSEFLIQVDAPALSDTSFVDNLSVAVKRKTKNFPKRGDERLKGMRILLVEDVVDNQALMVHFLNLAGATVEVANDGYEGVAKALAGKFDAVLMDIQMPKLDGYEATKRLRQQGYKTPIIALTAHALNEERDKSIEAGCDDHLSKPVEFNSLIEHLVKFSPKKPKEGERSAE
ncbi:response regulator [Bdellovibrio sp. 22V]|uniref:hybrid sensor histidine kinase/response regulator n=1 Tax=Bdellovibrio TaxID=958 RepID=UPI0025429227|nr:response regulator [Bdellovibrio sp. 22V]WII72383.1 response regulator [Bdellovibrio sp. 22V]